MSPDGSGTRWWTGSPGRGSGRRPTRARPSTTNVSPVSKVTRQRGGAGAPCRARTSVRSSAARAGTGVGWAAVGRRRARPAAASPGPRSAGGPAACAGLGARGSDAGCAAGAATVGRLLAPGTSRIAVRLTICRGALVDLLDLQRAPAGRRRRSRAVTWSCQPRRWRPRSITAVQASVATPSPKVGRRRDAEDEGRGAAPGRTPIGVPDPWCTTRSPSAPCRARCPRRPSRTAKTTHEHDDRRRR